MEQYIKAQTAFIASERNRYALLQSGVNHKLLKLHDLSMEQINARFAQLEEMEKEIEAISRSLP